MSEQSELSRGAQRPTGPGPRVAPAADQRASGARQRFFYDDKERLWTVAELPIAPEERTPGDDAAEAMGFRAAWLVFTCGLARRRLLLYPRNWHALAGEELEELCRRARRVLDD